MNIFLDSPGNMEFQLKYKESIYGYACHIIYCHEEILVSEFWRMSRIPSYISQEKSMVSLYQNISKDKELNIIFDYTEKGVTAKVQPLDLNKLKSSVILNSNYFFAATVGVTFEEVEEPSLLRLLIKVKKIKLSGNGMIFFIRDGNKTYKELDLEPGEEMIVGLDNIICYTDTLKVNPNNKKIDTKHEVFYGPGKIFIEK